MLKGMFKSIGNSVKNVDGMKVLGAVGTICGIAATLISNSTQKKEMEKTIEDKVAKALQKQNGGVQ